MNHRILFPACVAAAAILHAAPFLALQEGGTQAGGDGGTGQVTLTAASSELIQQVARWNRPQVVHPPASLAEPPASSAAPLHAITAALTTPSIPAASALAPAAQSDPLPAQPSPTTPPPPPPASAAPAQAKLSPASAAKNEKAAGSGQRRARGDNGADEASTGNSLREAQLKRRWGAAILSRVERQMRWPRGGEQGIARVRLKVSAQGQLIAVSVVRSSGSSRLDQAALQAAQKASYPRAPKALAPGDYLFDFSPRFSK
ncbi:TonB family protein [Leisingera methylohalidivorans]|uniref:TonB family protein n=1 Tax=Leisingera methylohalidivorans TaxID=133924 RepID=UPI0005C56831